MSDTKSLLKHGTILLVLGNLGNISNTLFNSFIAHNLTPSDLGTFSKLKALMSILGVATAAIQLTTAQQVSASLALNQVGNISSLFWYSLKRTLLAGILVTSVFIITIPFLASYQHVYTFLYYYIIALTLFLSFIYPIFLGTLQGIQNIFGYGFNGFLGSIGRLIIGVLLVLLGFRVVGALIAFPGQFIISILYGLFLLRNVVRVSTEHPTKSVAKDFEGLYQHIFPTTLALWLFSVLSQLDMIIVGHYFLEKDVGLYASVALVGQAFLFIPATFTQVMLPKISGEHAAQRETKHILDKTILYGFVLCMIGIIICVSFPEIILRLLSGKQYLSVTPLVRWFPIAITPLALSNIFLNYQLARLKIKFILSFVIVTILHATLLLLFHANFYQVLMVIGFSGSLIFSWNYYIVRKEVSSES